MKRPLYDNDVPRVWYFPGGYFDSEEDKFIPMSMGGHGCRLFAVFAAKWLQENSGKISQFGKHASLPPYKPPSPTSVEKGKSDAEEAIRRRFEESFESILHKLKLANCSDLSEVFSLNGGFVLSTSNHSVGGWKGDVDGVPTIVVLDNTFKPNILGTEAHTISLQAMPEEIIGRSLSRRVIESYMEQNEDAVLSGKIESLNAWMKREEECKNRIRPFEERCKEAYEKFGHGSVEVSEAHKLLKEESTRFSIEFPSTWMRPLYEDGSELLKNLGIEMK